MYSWLDFHSPETDCDGSNRRFKRGTMHQWKNVTPDGGKLRMVACAQPIAGAIEVDGKKLETEWKF